MTPTTPDQELRSMVGDLLMQIAVLRAEVHNLKAEQARPNGRDKEAADDYRPEPN